MVISYTIPVPKKSKNVNSLYERAMGIEPTSQPWEGYILPLYYARIRKEAPQYILAEPPHFFNKLLFYFFHLYFCP